ncbi:MAG: D-alanyl-D-alanine carboxypeptidase [Chloroflexi bacterium]|nr:MAG: D-alanyl-D-alanine carboxypeptidase [Chloroflexota bacterium]
MLSAIGRTVGLMLIAAGACSALASAGPIQPVEAVQPPDEIAAVTDLGPLEPRPPRLHLPPDPTPSPTPAPTMAAPATAPVRVAVAAARAIPLPVIDAQEIALVNLDTGRFLWQSHAVMAWAPASLTKIFTAMVAVDVLGMSATVAVPSSIRATFIADMNAKAARLGLRITHFLNPTGLDQPGHYSSAHDLAIAAMYLESHYGSLVTIAATPSITFPATASHKAFNLVSLDKLLWTYPGTYGLKTGWTDAALGCLITTSSRGGHRLLAVMLGAPAGTAYAQMPKLLDYGFQLLGVLPRPPVP